MEKMCLQNESIDLYTLKSMHAICRKLDNASFIQNTVTHSYSYFKYFFFCLATICTELLVTLDGILWLIPEKHCNYL